MINCWILDDQYGEIIYQSLKGTEGLNFPVKTNVNSPIPYLEQIKDGDIILLDNYFPGKTWEEAAGGKFLCDYFEKGLECKIICISDYGKRLAEMYNERYEAEERGHTIGYVPDKDPKKIKNLILKNTLI